MAHMAGMRLEEIVSRLGGELVGDANAQVSRVATLQNAGPGDLSFLSHARYRSHLQFTRATAVILPPSERDAIAIPRIISDDPYFYFAQVARLFLPLDTVAPGIHATAVVEADAIVAPSAHIGPGVYVGHQARIEERVVIGPNCSIGDDAVVAEESRLHANVTLYSQCRLGRRNIVHSGAVIGADGFGMALKNGVWHKIPQTGKVIIGDDVEIGANTTIDRGALDDTVIENGVKLDNQIQVGHNVRIGEHSAFAGCVGIAGSARIGRRCTVGGGAIILGHLEIADDVHIAAATLVTKSIPRSGNYAGAYPFGEQRSWARSAAALRHLDDLVQRVTALEALLTSPKREDGIPRRSTKTDLSHRRIASSKKAKKG